MQYNWLYIDFNSYFASVEQTVSPRLRHKPVVVVPVETDSTCAIAASYEAKAYGIKTGTPIYEAKKRCPQLICVLANHSKYVDYHYQLIEAIEQHLPIEAVRSIDEVACSLMGSQCALEKASQIAADIKQTIYTKISRYLCCSIGLGPNMYLAKVATNLEKPDGFVALNKQSLATRLQGSALKDFPGIGENMYQRLISAGIRTTESLLALDGKRMRHIWGSVAGERFWYALHGYDMPSPPTQKRSLGHSHVLAPEFRPIRQARTVSQRLLVKAAYRLRTQSFYATKLTLSIRVENGPRLAYETKHHPLRDDMSLSHLHQVLWDTMMSENSPGRIKKVSVQLSGLTRLPQYQADLFDKQQVGSLGNIEKFEKLSETMDNLNARFGRDTITLGITPEMARQIAVNKVAFSRIPDKDEY